MTKVITNISDISSAIQTSLKKLQTDYVDLYLIHSPFFEGGEDKKVQQAKWKEMEEVKKKGLARSIGVSNYLPEQLEMILEGCEVPPAINQIEFHPYLQHEGLVEFHKEKVCFLTIRAWICYCMVFRTDWNAMFRESPLPLTRPSPPF